MINENYRDDRYSEQIYALVDLLFTLFPELDRPQQGETEEVWKPKIIKLIKKVKELEEKYNNLQQRYYELERMLDYAESKGQQR